MPKDNLEQVSEEVMKNMAKNVIVLIKSVYQYKSIQKFEEEAQISIGYLSRMKKASRNPSLAVLVRIAELLNVSLDALLYSHFGESKTDNETVQYLNYLKKQTMNSTIRWTKLPSPTSEEYDSVLYDIKYTPYDEDCDPIFSYNFIDMNKENSTKWSEADEFVDYMAKFPDKLNTSIYARLMKKDKESRLDIILVESNNSPEVLCKISTKETSYEPLLEAAKALSDAINQQMCDTSFNSNVQAIMSRLQKEVPLNESIE